MTRFLLLFTLLAQTVLAQEGISFVDVSFEAALLKAQDEKKLVFIDTYADWCGPCHQMEKEVFTDWNVKKFYDQNFVNLKLDVETEAGEAIASQYNVRVLPTFLFLDGTGALIHKGVGYKEASPFLELGKAALNPDLQLRAMQQRYETGEQDPEFLYQYAKTLDEVLEDGSEVSLAYLRAQENWDTDENRALIFRMVEQVDSDLYQYILKNRAGFDEQFGDEIVAGKILSILYDGMLQSEENAKTPDDLKEAYLGAFPNNGLKLFEEAKLGYLLYNKGIKEYVDALEIYVNTYHAKDAESLQYFALNLSLLTSEKPYLEQGLKWIKKAVKLDNNYMNNAVLSEFYLKLGKDKQALKAAKKAIALAKKEGIEDIQGEKILKEIQSRKKQ